MIRKISLATLSVVLAVSALSCTCAAEKGAVSRLQDQHEKLFTKYSAYVNADPKFKTQADRDDELKLLQSLRDITSSLKRSLGD